MVFGEGHPDADIMFVAEGPGYHDDRSGHQLSGLAGELFDELLASLDLTRADVWITSVVKCRTPDGRSSFPDEIELCEGYLFREVALVRPRVICALGNTPIRLLTGRPLRLTDLHGTAVEVPLAGRDVTVLPLYHPAAVVQVPVLTDTLRADMRLIPALVRRAAGADVSGARCAPAASTPAASAQPGPPVTPSPKEVPVPDAAHDDAPPTLFDMTDGE